MNWEGRDLEFSETKELRLHLLQGVVSRAGVVFLVWSFVTAIYGILSISLFRQKMPDLTIWQNVWPRLLFSTLPLLIAASFYRRPRSHTYIKALLTIVLMPLFLMAASMIHAWPLFWAGHHDFYLYFHATNIIAMASGIFVISASPYLVLGQAAGFVFVYFGPLLWLFARARPELAQVIVSDTLLVTLILFLTSRSIHKLRVQVAAEESRRRRKAALFLGKRLSDAIYENPTTLISDYTRDGLIMSIDLRGYTRFLQTSSQVTVRNFLNDYHAMINKVLATKRCFLHKTIGDGLLLSIGVMDNDVDLTDIADEQANQAFAKGKKSDCLRQAHETFVEAARGLEELVSRHQIPVPLVIGAGCAYGPIDVFIRGDESYRQELDIQGTAIVRAVRLEAYSKYLKSKIDTDASFLIIEPDLAVATVPEQGFQVQPITDKTQQVRDFPEIDAVYFRRWQHRRSRQQASAA